MSESVGEELHDRPSEADGPRNGASHRLDLRPGHEIQIQAVNSKAKIVARYVGQCDRRYLIVRNGGRSQDSIEHMRFMQDEMALARFVLHGVAFGFRAPVLCVHRVPEPLLYLQWPNQVAEHAIRSAMRIPCFAAARVDVAGTVHDAALTDVSESGCRVDLVTVDADTVQEGDDVAVRAFLPGQREPADVAAVVRRRQRGAGDRLVLGLEFRQSQDALLDAMRAYLPEAD